ncbi:MAG: transcriptional coactivator p15/PC4 family protein [Acidobacteria bacterium]|nr:transcriptional coactivator p15/PC4 family protein [Acidobacteriota bacterium]MCZ6768420.1 transcriptional coactivator p15/PC4 family protein [Acidobacteriota bacterium]MCZ6876514.1 transcriptional coactivator p15/PC4 family protein [Acidobacteriota bacterium]
MSEVIAEMEKSWNEKIVFSLSDYKGKNYADIRIYFEDDEGEWKPTKKGITIGLDRFSEFKENLGQLEKFLTSEGHLPAEEG